LHLLGRGLLDMPGLRMPADHDAETLFFDARDGGREQGEAVRIRPAGAVQHQFRLHGKADEGKTGAVQFDQRRVVDIAAELRIALVPRKAEPVGEVDAARKGREARGRHLRPRRHRQDEREGEQESGGAATGVQHVRRPCSREMQKGSLAQSRVAIPARFRALAEL
jgi:hypothetical protein